ALAARLSDVHALAFMRSRNSEDIPDWGRISLATGASVEAGNLFAGTAVSKELEEAGRVLDERWDGAAAPRWIAPAAEPAEGRCLVRAGQGLVPRVIDRASWARFYERHALSAAVNSVRHQRVAMGLDDDADAGWRTAVRLLGAAKVFPAAVVVAANPDASGRGRGAAIPGGTQGCGAAAALASADPSSLTAPTWRGLQAICSDVA